MPASTAETPATSEPVVSDDAAPADPDNAVAEVAGEAGAEPESTPDSEEPASIAVKDQEKAPSNDEQLKVANDQETGEAED
jgi:hypothetical protein